MRKKYIKNSKCGMCGRTPKQLNGRLWRVSIGGFIYDKYCNACRKKNKMFKYIKME